MCPALSHRCISLRDFASLSGYQSSVCCCTLLLPGLWTLTSHLSNCFSFIGLDFDFFFPQTVPSKVLRGSLYADVQARSLSPSQSQRKCGFLGRLITRDTELPSARCCPHLGKQWCPTLGREAWLGISLCSPWRRLFSSFSFSLGPELMPVSAWTQHSPKAAQEWAQTNYSPPSPKMGHQKGMLT